MTIESDKMSNLNDTYSENEDGQDLWAGILTDSNEKSSLKVFNDKRLLVLGDNESGKTTLISKLQGKEDPIKGAGLEFYYIDVKDDYRDDNSKLGVYLAEGDSDYISLLKFALNEETFENCLILLVASMSAPWNILESLKKWTEVLKQHVTRLKLSPEKLKEFEESIVTHFREYTEPDDNIAASMSRRAVINPLHPSPSDENRIFLPLGESSLINNLGIPIIVVLTKSDCMSNLEKENDFKDEHFDFIQQHVRKFCLNFGASLFYVSVKENRNLDLLYRYIVHRIYGFPFNMPALVVEKDAVFIPAGWDNEKKISILYENLSSVSENDAFEDTICKPIIRKAFQREIEIIAEDEQIFLLRQQSQLSKQPNIQSRDSPIRTGITKPSAAGVRVSPNVSNKKDGLKSGSSADAGNGVLASFFNSLLSKNPTQATRTSSPSAKALPETVEQKKSSNSSADFENTPKAHDLSSASLSGSST